MKILSFDSETNGLWGSAFAIGAILYGEDGKEERVFSGRCPIGSDSESINPWVQENVLPQMEGIPENFSSYEELLKAFAGFYLENKADATVLVHMGVPVEVRLFLDMHNLGLIGDWDGPYPLIDIAGNLQQAGFDPTSVDAYNASHGIEVPKTDAGGTHNPLYDSRAAALCYMHLMNK